MAKSVRWGPRHPVWVVCGSWRNNAGAYPFILCFTINVFSVLIYSVSVSISSDWMEVDALVLVLAVLTTSDFAGYSQDRALRKLSPSHD